MANTVIEPRLIDSDRVDEGGRQWPVVLATLIVGLVLGALVGGIYGATRPATYEASTALSVQPDPTIDVTSQDSNQNGAPTLDASAYIQSQLVIINGAQLADRVRSAAKLPSRPDVSATQVGQTYVVDIVATAATRERAVTVARETGALYIAARSSLLRTEISTLLTSTKQQLAGVASSLTAQRSKSSTSPLTPSQTALQTEYERLLSVRSTLNAVSAQANQVVTVVSPARATDAALSSTVKDTLGGAVVGAILALIAFVALRRTVHRVRSIADLAALDVPVILPVQPKRSLLQARRRAFWKSPQARLLAARLFAEADVERRPLVFVGTAPGVGTTSVAASVAAALVGSGPVLFVQVEPTPVDRTPAPLTAGPPTDSPAVVPSSLPGVWLLGEPHSLGGGGAAATRRLVQLLDEANRSGWIVIVDAPPLSESDVAARCSRSGAALILVVGRGRSTPAGVLAASELFEAHGAGLVGAVLNDTVGPVRRSFEQRSPRRGSQVRNAGGRHTETAFVDAVPLDQQNRSGSRRPAPAAGPDLDGAELRDSDLRDSDLREPDLRTSDLRDSDRRAGLNGSGPHDADEHQNNRHPDGDSLVPGFAGRRTP